MRLIHRKARLALVVAALVSSFALAPAVADAATKGKAPSTKALNRKLNKLSARVKTIAKNLKDVTGTVNGGIPIITQLVTKLTQVGAGLTALQSGLTTLSAAVSNTTTGLPGLNAARSLVGAVVSNTAATGSEFTVTHPGPAGIYVLSFKDGAGNPADVSKRSVLITPLPNPGVDVNAQAANCSAAGVSCPGGDTKNTDELVVTQAGATPTDENIQVAAISG